MALTTRHAATVRNAATDAVTATIGASGFCDVYDGAQPTDSDTALGAQVKLAHLPLSATAFAAAVAGVATANAITTANALATGTAAWFSLTTSAGVRKIEGSVGTSGANLNLVTTSIVATQPVSVSSLTYTTPMQGA